MTRHTSPHDMPWFSDPDEPWGGSHKRIERDPDEEYERMRDAQIDDAPTVVVSTPEQIAARRAFVERHFANFPDLQQRLAMLDAGEK